MDIIKELKQKNAERNQCITEIHNLEQEKTAELEALKRQLMDKYAKKMMTKHQELREYNSSIDAYCKMIQAYSCFDARVLGKILAKMISIFEDEKYVYQDTYIISAETIIVSFKLKKNVVMKYVKGVVLARTKKNHYEASEIKNLENNGDILILDSDEEDKDTLTFYKVGAYDHELKVSGNLDKYPYIQEFMNRVIGYKIEHQILDLSVEELQGLADEFLEMKSLDIAFKHHTKIYSNISEE